MKEYQILLDDSHHYGRRRSKETILPNSLAGVVDYTRNCGWHKCNDKYFICRDAQIAYDYLLIFTVSGEGSAILERNEHRLVRNSLMIFPKNMRHEYNVPEGKTWEFYWIHLSGANCEALLTHITDKYGHHIHIGCLEEMGNYIEKLLTTQYRYYEYEFFAARVISNMLFALIESLNANAKNMQKRRTLSVKVITYIENHFRESMCLGDISASMYISTEHLIRMFHEETGMTPHQYLKQFRLRKACMLLNEPDMRIRDIAAAVGYSSLSSFIAQFKECYGLTPHRYRQFHISAPSASIWDDNENL